MSKAKITWKENEVTLTYSEGELSFDYESLPDTDLIIPGLELDKFNQMVEELRYNPKKFAKNFKARDPGEPGYQRCRAFALKRIYPDNFNVMCQSFCILAYRYVRDDMGSIDELESFYKDLQGFKKFNDPYSGKHSYRWTTSIWTALAHCYVKEGNAESAFKIFNKIHSFGNITLWPSAVVNVLGACWVTGQSEEYSKKIYETAIHMYDIKNVYKLSEILAAGRILQSIMGMDNNWILPLYVKANDLLKNYI